MRLQLKKADAPLQSKQMASIALTVTACIDCIAFGSIFMHAMFCPKNKLDVFFAKKSIDDCREVVG
jgi:hypothetical protein